MTFDTPSEWSRQPTESEQSGTIAAFEYKLPDASDTSTEQTTYVVSVHEASTDTKEYDLRLATIDPPSNYVRHDYPVETYDTRERALDRAEALMQHISSELQDRSIARATPDVNGTREMIRDFTDDRSFLPLRWLVRRIRR